MNLNIRISRDAFRREGRQYSAPETAEVAVIIPGDQDTERAIARHDVMYLTKDCEVRHINEIRSFYDPFHYVLLFPRGELGWHPNIVLSDADIDEDTNVEDTMEDNNNHVNNNENATEDVALNDEEEIEDHDGDETETTPPRRRRVITRQVASDRPDIVCTVFNEKLRCLMKNLKVNKIFGTVIASVYVAEFQKRELPDRQEEPELYEAVSQHMFHRPCGTYNRQASCMENVNGIVPFNKYVLLKYNPHINVEICFSARSVKYLYKYVYKGHDRAIVRLQEYQQQQQQ
ncbi:hypothetical protein VTP01DRAFT_1255 [Rhizomucor pusillus]|uniref:uncharacterized protein n=1 Tax=Rhizomucor pusillus TaxID=4840 RepID=UPI00374230FE